VSEPKVIVAQEIKKPEPIEQEIDLLSMDQPNVVDQVAEITQ